jgi:F0F1-type ATP synthase membrane subunit b/b'
VKLLIALSPFLSSEWALAGGDGGIPSRMVTIQTINLGLALVLLVYFTRNSVKNFFLKKFEDYQEEARKSEEAKNQAEKEKKEISLKLERLKNSQAETLAQARVEAEALKRKTLEEAQQISLRLQQEALMASQIELQKAKERLKWDLLTQASDLAQETMKQKVDVTDLKRMGNEFVEKIQVVQ